MDSTTRNNVRYEYLKWLGKLVQAPLYLKGDVLRSQYSQLFYKLQFTDFYYSIPMDGNRYEDGIALRYEFGREVGYDDAYIAHYLDMDSCSVLEMMVALAVRCQEHIIYDDEVEYQAGSLFWEMISNLGLIDMTDRNYDSEYVDDVLETFLLREYSPDGRGGLFWIDDCDKDLRSVEIWYQLNWYLNDIYREEE